jgi:hypothetical protein
LLPDFARHYSLIIVPERKQKEITVGSTASEVVSRLIARESSGTADPNPAAIAATVLQHISADLSRFIGSDGCHALLLRAHAHAHEVHPALKNISISAQPNLSVHGVPESIQSHGAAEIAAGLESTLVAVIELLGRLIGDELAMKLVEQNSADVALPDKQRRRNDQ